LGAYLNHYQWTTWQSSSDSSRIIDEILKVANVQTQIDESKISTGAVSDGPETQTDLCRPWPMVDPRTLGRPGGSLRPDDPLYVQRTADREILDAARRLDETVVIKGPRQIGKSSLLKRYLFECRRLGKKTVLIDFSLFSELNFSDYPTFLSSLTTELIEELDIDCDVQLDISSQPEMSRFVRRKFLRAIPGQVVVAFDEVDRILGRSYQSDFFSMLRYWHECRADTSTTDWARLELALVVSTEPYLLIEDANRSPFNVREPITLKPFTNQECRQLNRLYNNALSSEQVQRLFELLNGLPYLTRLAYYWLTGPKRLDFSALLREAHRDNGPFGDHLRAVLTRLKRYRSEDLVAALRQTIEHGTVRTDDIYYRLHGAGLVHKEDERIVPTNQLYARFFGGIS